MKKTTYRTYGTCLGKLWGGGEGAYPTHIYTADDLDTLIKTVKAEVESGAIDSGMGFEKIIGTVMTIETTTTIEVDGQEYKNITYGDEEVVFGELTDKQVDFITSCEF